MNVVQSQIYKKEQNRISRNNGKKLDAFYV